MYSAGGRNIFFLSFFFFDVQSCYCHQELSAKIIVFFFFINYFIQIYNLWIWKLQQHRNGKYLSWRNSKVNLVGINFRLFLSTNNYLKNKITLQLFSGIKQKLFKNLIGMTGFFKLSIFFPNCSTEGLT